MSFKTIPLEKSSIQLIDGDRGKNYPKESDFFEKEHCLFLSAKNVTATGFEFTQTSFIDKSKDELLRAGKLQRNDIVMTTRGTIGNVAFYGEDIPFDNVRINSGMMIFRANIDEWNPRFLYFLLTSNFIQEQISSLTSGSAVPQLPARDLKKFELPEISIDTQNKIESIVGAIVDKIKLNQRTNQTLEQIAQALFKSWFVDFEPTRAKIFAKEAGASSEEIERAAMCAISGKTPDQLAQLPPETQQNLKTTAALFPDALVDSELGEVPEGWEILPLDGIAEIIMGQSPNGDSYNENGEGELLINGPVEFGEYHPKKIKWTTSPTKFSDDKDLIVCVRGSTTGRYVKSDGKYCLGRGVCAIRSKNNQQAFVDQLFKHCLEKLLTHATGSTFPSWNGPVLKNYKVNAAISELRGNYSSLVQEFENQISLNAVSIQDLSNLRDALLPKLLSGELAT